MRVRALTYNVRGFRDGLHRVAAVVSHFEPDVVLLNETGGRAKLRRFARAVSMQVARDPWSPLRRRIKDAVLVRAPWRIARSRQVRFETMSWLYPRGALVVDVRRDGMRILAIAVHLSLRPGERLRHARALMRAVGDFPGPVILGGDLNEKPDGDAVAYLRERFWDAWLLGGDASGETFPAEEPTARIDYVFVSEGIRVERAVVPGGPDVRIASDHRPVVAALVFPEPSLPRRR